MHHFLPERIAFSMTALRCFLPECIAPRTTRGRHTVRVVLDACREYVKIRKSGRLIIIVAS